MFYSRNVKVPSKRTIRHPDNDSVSSVGQLAISTGTRVPEYHRVPGTVNVKLHWQVSVTRAGPGSVTRAGPGCDQGEDRGSWTVACCITHQHVQNINRLYQLRVID